MKDIVDFVRFIVALKATKRTGWNMKPSPRHQWKTRRVKNAESVAAHSWGLAMLALLVANLLGLDAFRLVAMALVHDLAEAIAGDIVTATEVGKRRARLLAIKKRREHAAIRRIVSPLRPKLQELILGLWLEYDANETPEAHALHQLDKLEALLQSHHYANRGEQVDPMEFVHTTDSIITDPVLQELQKIARRRIVRADRRRRNRRRS